MCFVWYRETAPVTLPPRGGRFGGANHSDVKQILNYKLQDCQLETGQLPPLLSEVRSVWFETFILRWHTQISALRHRRRDWPRAAPARLRAQAHMWWTAAQATGTLNTDPKMIDSNQLKPQKKSENYKHRKKNEVQTTAPISTNYTFLGANSKR